MSHLSQFNVKDDVVLITGGAGILGQNFIEAFLQAGAIVAACDLDSDAIKLLNSKFKSGDKSNQFEGFVADISNISEIESLVNRVEQKLGPIRHLINNAASKGSDVSQFMRGPDDFGEKTWEEVEKVNLKAPFFVSRFVANRLKHHELSGSVTMVSSIYGIISPNPDLYEGSLYLEKAINTPPIYSASKSGILGLARYLAAYWGEYGIRVNCITPGGVYSGQNDEFKDRYSQRVPMKRMARPNEIVGAAVFLASPAASYINGTNIVIDGGFSIW